MNYFGSPTPDNTNAEPKMKLTVNKVKCLVCGAILESKFRHDFLSCNCENQTFADGGLDYLRRGGVDMSKVEDMSEWEEEK